MQVTASEIDSVPDVLTYSIFVGDTSLFTMNATTGVLSLTGALDFETQEAYSLILRVTDNDTVPLFDEVR